MDRGSVLLRVDAIGEVALGLTLVTSPVTGLSAQLQLPRPATERRAAAFGAGLLPFGGLLWWAARRATRPVLASVAAVNLATAAVLSGWFSVRRTEMNAAAATLTLGTAAGLAALAAAEASAVRSTSA